MSQCKKIFEQIFKKIKNIIFVEGGIIFFYFIIFYFF